MRRRAPAQDLRRSWIGTPMVRLDASTAHNTNFKTRATLLGSKSESSIPISSTSCCKIDTKNVQS